MQSNNLSKKAEKERKKYLEELAKEVTEDFENRKKIRLPFERQWELNMQFVAGNQYCDLSSRGDIINESKEYFWQNRRVYNHIAPLVDSRLAKFSRISPDVSVRPKTDDDLDVNSAMLAEKLISWAFKKGGFENVIRKVTSWSETCGTGFYKVIWNNDGGIKIGEFEGASVYEGEVSVLPVSPFEIFPDNIYTEDIKDCQSIIHARAVSVDNVFEKYGVLLKGGNVSVYRLDKNGVGNQDVIENSVVVIERYERPSKAYPSGRLVTVACDKVLFEGDLPYVNGADGVMSFPFVKQECLTVAGNFFGVSIVDRLIPVQRAFNAVKNRKHEFLNRLSMGLITVEDGSVDVDDLAEDGLSPGKVLVYRQGAKAPEFMSNVNMPDDFNKEEDGLINEFVIISGISDVVSSSSNASVSSGTALQLLIEQDNSRLLMSAEEIRRCILEVARHTVRLYAQFSEGGRVVKGKDNFGRTRVYYADQSIANCDDVYLESENELLYTPSQKKEMVFKLYNSGLLSDEQGKLRPSTKEKVLTLLGYKDLDYQKGLSRLQEEKAISENEKLLIADLPVDQIDDHSIHVDEHTRYVLCEYQTLTEEEKKRIYKHITEHKNQLKNNLGE